MVHHMSEGDVVGRQIFRFQDWSMFLVTSIACPNRRRTTIAHRPNMLVDYYQTTECRDAMQVFDVDGVRSESIDC